MGGDARRGRDKPVLGNGIAQNGIPAGEPGKEMVQLTGREREIIERMAQGWNNKKIAEDLHLNLQTVRNYISNLYSKLGVHSRAETIVWARERNIGS